MQVGNCLDVWEDARGDHQGQHVDSDQQHGADDECYQQGNRNLNVKRRVSYIFTNYLGIPKAYLFVNVYLNHCHHCKTRKKRRRSTRGLELGAAQVKHLPVVNILVDALKVK